MATAVNDQITDAVTQANVKVIGEAPAVALGTLYQAMAKASGVLFQNAVAAQQQQNVLGQAATTQGVMQIYSVDTASGASATEAIAQRNAPDLQSLLTVLQGMK